jgi:site-specific DNA-methyltransferase (adenine-specific)
MLLLHGDCLEVMKTLPDKSVDLFVCDLPYGCLTNQSGPSKGFLRDNQPEELKRKLAKQSGEGCAWDVKLDLTQFWVQVKRLCKDDHTPVLMFCSTKFGFDLYNSNPDWFRYDLVWNKQRGISFLAANKMPMRSHEMIYVFSKKGATYYRTDTDDPTKSARKKNQEKLLNGDVYNPQTNRTVPLHEGNDTPAGKRCVLSVIDGYSNTDKKGKHPTQKPDDLYEWLITRYSKEGDTVLDPTAGSFASVFTAERLGRNAIGIEKDDAFYAKASLHQTTHTPPQ